MDESLAELAVRTRRATSADGELRAALEAGEVVKAFAFRGAVHYLRPEDGGIYLSLRCAGRQWELRAGGVLPARPRGLAGLPGRGAGGAGDGPLTVGELGAALTRQRDYRHWAGLR